MNDRRITVAYYPQINLGNYWKELVYLGMTPVLDYMMSEFHKGFFQKKENVLTQAFAKAGYENLTPEFMKQHCVIKISPDDPYDHYFIDDTRIISIQRMPDLINEGVNMKLNATYY